MVYDIYEKTKWIIEWLGYSEFDLQTTLKNENPLQYSFGTNEFLLCFNQFSDKKGLSLVSYARRDGQIYNLLDALPVPTVLLKYSDYHNPIGIYENLSKFVGLPLELNGKYSQCLRNVDVKHGVFPGFPDGLPNVCCFSRLMDMSNGKTRILYAFCLDMGMYAAWLRSPWIKRNLVFSSSSEFTSPTDIVKDCGYGELGIVHFPSPGIRMNIFKVEANDYSFEAFILNSKLIMQREGIFAEMKIPYVPPKYLKYARSVLLIHWSQEKFGASIVTKFVVDGELVSDENIVNSTQSNTFQKDTNFMYVPEHVEEDLRLAGGEEKKVYKSSQELFFTVKEILDSVAKAAEKCKLSFWNNIDAKNKTPKKEPDNHGLINSLLFPYLICKHIKLTHEVEAAGGNLDFLLTGENASGQNINVALEVKNAHEDVKQGLWEQLPAYMKATKSEYGIFLVLWFKGRFFDEPNQDLFEFTMKLQDLANEKKLLPNVYPLVLNCSLHIPPSQIKI